MHMWPTTIRPSFLVEVVGEIVNRITADPFDTARSVLCRLDVPKTTALKILNTILQMLLCQFQRVQNLQSVDEKQRMDFGFFLLIIYDKDNIWALQILCTDKAHVPLTGDINSKNHVHDANYDPPTLNLRLNKKVKWLRGANLVAKHVRSHPYYFKEVTSILIKTCSYTSAWYRPRIAEFCNCRIAALIF